MSERGSGKETVLTLSTDALRLLMTKQQKTALNMAKFIQNQS
ncbi:Rop family plasmid primer RNA-binding protein, partial [Enterobacter hormaechei]|nr:Rop family plasmid primer RNA-binding protein [Enterobacter hormaechei]